MDGRWAGAIVVQGVPLDVPRKLHPESRFAHADTGFPMPESAGPFARVAVTQFDAEGRHLAAGYNALVGDELPLPVVSAVFVYPAPPAPISTPPGPIDPERMKAIVALTESLVPPEIAPAEEKPDKEDA
jgi:hypothetical protein